MLATTKTHYPNVFDHRHSMMLVRHPIITIQRAGDRRMIAANKSMRGLNNTTLLSMPPVPFFEELLSRLVC